MSEVRAPRVQAGSIVVGGLPMPEFRRLKVTPLTGAGGAEIEGVDLRQPLEPDVLDEILKAFEHFLVLVFRNQNLTPEQHQHFSRYFGELMDLRATPQYPGYPMMQEVRREADEPATVVPTASFHVDSPFRTRPPLAIVMRALDVPAYGGDTAFANMYMCYEDLSPGLKAVLNQLKVVYSWKGVLRRNALQGSARMRIREGVSEDETEDNGEVENSHNAVRRHPLTGRKALFVARAFFKCFEGWSEAESQNLMLYLDSLPHKLKYQFRVKWAKDTIIIWDNRFTQHAGVHDYENERRHLVRTTVIGEVPL